MMQVVSKKDCSMFGCIDREQVRKFIYAGTCFTLTTSRYDKGRIRVDVTITENSSGFEVYLGTNEDMLEEFFDEVIT